MADRRRHKVYKTLIAERLPVRYPTVYYTAHRLGIPVRTLQRRLKESGLSLRSAAWVWLYRCADREGLRQHEIPLALLMFNVVVKLRQLVFIAAMLPVAVLPGARVA